eukprot:CAMPEP_0117433728 /NCGR_PEP_ID=MMETSP0758-20121206/13028_1 /TAXON_ID=63605 /ORGANISM="Percolomonas cosmopolitus, Strain AE-1 (ATCC 50343)" /LENGTH=107 /DNA_ID=CAMNT_0005224559 /DNA_START=304 /DNA_END=623 /DNA_ORIENTATION=-
MNTSVPIHQFTIQGQFPADDDEFKQITPSELVEPLETDQAFPERFGQMHDDGEDDFVGDDEFMELQSQPASTQIPITSVSLTSSKRTYSEMKDTSVPSDDSDSSLEP